MLRKPSPRWASPESAIRQKCVAMNSEVLGADVRRRERRTWNDGFAPKRTGRPKQ